VPLKMVDGFKGALSSPEKAGGNLGADTMEVSCRDRCLV
jgi:hypothetical protein